MRCEYCGEEMEDKEIKKPSDKFCQPCKTLARRIKMLEGFLKEARIALNKRAWKESEYSAG